jgi:hypothetical protein
VSATPRWTRKAIGSQKPTPGQKAADKTQNTTKSTLEHASLYIFAARNTARAYALVAQRCQKQKLDRSPQTRHSVPKARNSRASAVLAPCRNSRSPDVRSFMCQERTWPLDPRCCCIMSNYAHTTLATRDTNTNVLELSSIQAQKPRALQRSVNLLHSSEMPLQANSLFPFLSLSLSHTLVRASVPTARRLGRVW